MNADARSFHPLSFSMPEFFIAFILLGWLLRGRQRGGEGEGRYLNAPMIALALAALAGIFLAGKPSEATRIAFERFYEPLILFFVMTHRQWDRSRLRLAVGVFLMVITFVAIRSLYLHFTGHVATEETSVDIDKTTGKVHEVSRLAGEWAALNPQAAFFVLLTPMAFLWGLYHPSGAKRLFAFLAFGICSLAIALTCTRAAWLAMGATLAWLARKRPRALVFVLLVAIVVGALGTRDMMMRGETLLDPMSDVSATNRLVVWGDTIDMMVHAHFLGIGLGTWARIYHPGRLNTSATAHPHNDFLLMAAELGIIGLVVFLILILKVVATLRRAGRRATALDQITLAGLGAALVSALMQSNFDCILAWPQFGLAFWFALGLAAAYGQSILAESESSLEGGLEPPRVAGAFHAGAIARRSVEGSVRVAR